MAAEFRLDGSDAVTEETNQGAASPFTETPYEDSPGGWWTEYGGAKDVKSGVVYLPRAEYPRCPFECHICDHREDQAILRRQFFRRMQRALRSRNGREHD
ncbi:hypothetical protein GTZ89_30305 [Streptomyces sp. SID8382]|uniref:hypothetical protein n=1 Tax=Streptomyces malaysiensis TaxID=92644 RepID=UPI0013317B24|nr:MULTISPECIES: hypothetical protein [unclassified Streptomyces]MYX59815.1 hypothetical protein [Streptomyces sp. SID8382]